MSVINNAITDAEIAIDKLNKVDSSDLGEKTIATLQKELGELLPTEEIQKNVEQYLKETQKSFAALRIDSDIKFDNQLEAIKEKLAL